MFPIHLPPEEAMTRLSCKSWQTPMYKGAHESKRAHQNSQRQGPADPSDLNGLVTLKTRESVKLCKMANSRLKAEKVLVSIETDRNRFPHRFICFFGDDGEIQGTEQ